MSVAQVVIATNSASQVESVAIGCFLDAQCIATPCKNTMLPEMDLYVICKELLYHLLTETSEFLVQMKLFGTLQLDMNRPFLVNY